jgi:beta-lactamase class A
MDQDRFLGTRQRVSLCASIIVFITLGFHAAANPASPASWKADLEKRLHAVDEAFPGELGVYVKDLDSGDAVSFRGDEYWYLASGIKVPVAVEVLRRVDAGEFTLDTRMRLKESDFVDGAGSTNYHPPGTKLAIGKLIHQMLVYSDNTASDMLIRLVGLESVNALIKELVPNGFGPITTLADVRRHAYSHFHENAFSLASADLLAIRNQRQDERRIAAIAKSMQVSRDELKAPDLDTVFAAYYATNLNAGTLQAFATLLERIHAGEALSPESTAYLLDVMRGVKTGDRRIKRELPQGTTFAHKTGTQHARTCDLGVAETGAGEEARRVVVAACTRGLRATAQSEEALRRVGAAVRTSGVLGAHKD